VPELKELKPTYLIYGTERVLLDDAVARLKAQVAEQGDLDFNYDVFHADNSEAEAIVAASQTLPFMSERRLVVVRDVHLLPADAQRVIARYVADPSPLTCLVLVADKMTKGNVLYKAVQAGGGQIHEYEAPRKSRYPAWIRERLAERGKKVTSAAAMRIFEVIGDDVGRLRNEIDKICLYYDDRIELDTDEVDEVLSATTQATIFELTDSIGNRDRQKALRTLQKLLDRSEPLPAIYHTVLRHVRMVLAAKVLTERGIGQPSAIARELKLIEFVARKYRDQSRNFTIEQLRDLHRQLVQIDFDVKSGRGELLTALERFLLRMA